MTGIVIAAAVFLSYLVYDIWTLDRQRKDRERRRITKPWWDQR
jgi:hypothetical protein